MGQHEEDRDTCFRLSTVAPNPGSQLGMQNCTFPLLLYRKCLSTVPGTTSVHRGLPCRTALRITSMAPLRCNCCVLRKLRSNKANRSNPRMGPKKGGKVGIFQGLHEERVKVRHG